MKIPLLFGIACLLIAPVFAQEPSEALILAKHFKIIQKSSLTFPLSMSHKGISSGVVRVVLHVSSEGKLIDCLPVAYTNKAFADEVMRSLQEATFEPEYVNGEAVDTVTEATFNFESTGIKMVPKFIFEAIPGNEELHGYEFQACSMKKLDSIPTPVNVVNPAYPAEWAEKGITGTVVVDFYIDETGRVRVPAVLSGASAELAGIAMDAVSKWQFSPPTRKGKPVLVHAQQTFDFGKNTPMSK